jgi:hypothetical protein
MSEIVAHPQCIRCRSFVDRPRIIPVTPNAQRKWICLRCVDEISRTAAAVRGEFEEDRGPIRLLRLDD